MATTNDCGRSSNATPTAVGRRGGDGSHCVPPVRRLPGHRHPLVAQLLVATVVPGIVTGVVTVPVQPVDAQLRPVDGMVAQLRPAQLRPAQLRPAQLRPAQLRPATVTVSVSTRGWGREGGAVGTSAGRFSAADCLGVEGMRVLSGIHRTHIALTYVAYVAYVRYKSSG